MSYRFDWEIVGEAEITTRADSRHVLLSKAFVNDQDLMYLGDEIVEQPTEDNEIKITDSMEELNVNEDLKAEEDRDVVEESSVATTDSQVKGTGDESELPVVFGGHGKNRRMIRHRRGRRYHDDDRPEDFDSYWARVGECVVNRSWLRDFGDQMEKSAREAFEAKVEIQQPSRIMKADEQAFCNVFAEANEDILGLTDWTEIFTRFCEIVKERSKRNYEYRITKTSVAGKCKEFFHKIQKCGYVPGYSVQLTKAGDAYVGDARDLEEDSSEGDIKEEDSDESPSPKKRQSFNPEEIISRMDFTIYNERPLGKALVLNRDYSVVIKEEEKFEDDSEAMSEDLTNFNFAYDEEKDKQLLATNAKEVYSDDKEIMKYWWQRYRLFTKIDQGILLDREGWFSVTPERLAQHIADRLIQEPGRVILDAFAGVGGNSIQFAMKGAHVIAVDMDPTRLKCAKRNAEIYGVADKITFILGDFFHVAKMLSKQKPIDAVFLSPPWGGPSYLNRKEFDIATMMVPDGVKIFEAAVKLSPNIAYFLPRNTTINQLLKLAGPNKKCEIEHSVLNKKTKALTAYYGELVASD